MVIPAKKTRWPWLFPTKTTIPREWLPGDVYGSTYPGAPQQYPASQYTPPAGSTGRSGARIHYTPSLANRAADRPAVVRQADPNIPPGIMPYALMQWAGQQMAKYKGTRQWLQAMREVASGGTEIEFDQPVTPETPSDTTTGGGGGARYAPAPTGVDPQWYRQFQQEHSGQTPEEYYAQTGEDIGHALADEEWGQEFYEANGRPPNDYEWRWHWFMSRTGHPPPEGMERWLQEQKEGFGNEEEDQRPPTYQPPQIIWR